MNIKEKLSNKIFLKNTFNISLQIFVLVLFLILMNSLNFINIVNKEVLGIFFIIFGFIFFYLGFLRFKDKKFFSNNLIFISLFSFLIIIVNLKLNYLFLKNVDYIFYYLIVLSISFYLKNKQLKINLLSKKIYIPILLLIMLFALNIRLTNLTILDPYTDEYYHLNAAKNLMNNPSELTYMRAPIVSYSVYYFWKLAEPKNFEEELFWGRLVGVIFSVLLIIPLFFILNRFSPIAGLFGSFFWAISPWAIGVSKTIREYAYFPFFVMIGLWLLLIFSNYIKVKKDILKFKFKDFLVICLISIYFLIFSIFAIFLDSKSTLKIGLFIFGLSSIYILISKFKIIKSYYNEHATIVSIILFLILSLISLAGYFAVTTNQQTSVDNLKYDNKWSDLFLNPLRAIPLMWWNVLVVSSSLIYFFIFSGISFSISKKEYEYLNYVLIFGGTILFYSLFFDRYFKPRYIFYMLPLLVILISYPLSILYKIYFSIKNIFLKTIGIIFIFLFLFLIINYSNTAFTYEYSNYGINNATSEYHDNVRDTLIPRFGNIITPDTKLISGHLEITNYLFNSKPENVFYFDYRNKSKFDMAKNFMNSNDEGYIVIDIRRNKIFSKGFPLKNFTYKITNNKYINITLLMNDNGWNVYRWESVVNY